MFTLYDKILILVLLVIAASFFLFMKFHADNNADTVVIMANGKEAVRANLNTDQNYTVYGKIGKSEIEVRNGQVRMLDSSCLNKTCVRFGWIDKPYQSIICIPNRVIVTLISKNEKNGIDAITR